MNQQHSLPRARFRCVSDAQVAEAVVDLGPNIVAAWARPQ